MRQKKKKKESFGERLKCLRQRAGLTQGQLADRCSFSRMSISRWERNRRSPYWGHVHTLAWALGVDVSAFLEEKNGHATAPEENSQNPVN